MTASRSLARAATVRGAPRARRRSAASAACCRGRCRSWCRRGRAPGRRGRRPRRRRRTRRRRGVAAARAGAGCARRRAVRPGRPAWRRGRRRRRPASRPGRAGRQPGPPRPPAPASRRGRGGLLDVRGDRGAEPGQPGRRQQCRPGRVASSTPAAPRAAPRSAVTDAAGPARRSGRPRRRRGGGHTGGPARVRRARPSRRGTRRARPAGPTRWAAAASAAVSSSMAARPASRRVAQPVTSCGARRWLARQPGLVAASACAAASARAVVSAAAASATACSRVGRSVPLSPVSRVSARVRSTSTSASRVGEPPLGVAEPLFGRGDVIGQDRVGARCRRGCSSAPPRDRGRRRTVPGRAPPPCRRAVAGAGRAARCGGRARLAQLGVPRRLCVGPGEVALRGIEHGDPRPCGVEQQLELGDPAGSCGSRAGLRGQQRALGLELGELGPGSLGQGGELLDPRVELGALPAAPRAVVASRATAATCRRGPAPRRAPRRRRRRPARSAERPGWPAPSRPAADTGRDRRAPGRVR